MTFYVEEFGKGAWGIVDDGYVPTGAMVVGNLPDKNAAEFYCNLMNSVYHRVKLDIQNGYIVGGVNNKSS